MNIILIGASYFVSVLGVYVRDLSQFIGVLVTVMLFLGPIVYPFERVPEAIKFYVLWFNPLTIVVEQFRAVLLFGNQPDWLLLGQYSVFAVLMLIAGDAPTCSVEHTLHERVSGVLEEIEQSLVKRPSETSISEIRGV